MLTRSGARVVRALAGVAVLLAGVLATRPAAAHPMPATAVLLDIGERGVRAEVRLPLSELEVGYGRPLPPSSVRDSAAVRAAIGRYLAAHVGAVTQDGRAWTATVRSVGFGTEPSRTGLGDVALAIADLRLAPPAGAPVRRFTLRYDAVVHELITHRTLVSVRQDWSAGLAGGEPEFVGEIAWNRKSLDIDRAGGGRWAAFPAAFALGAHHIADGTDHLLFLLTLLLPAALVVLRRARQTRWGGFGGWQAGLGRLVRIVTAFTVGHSLTLALGALGGVRVTVGPVEVVIALSILVSALHALRPLFPDREGLVAGLFGLVHGLAFAEVLAGFGLGPLEAAVVLLGFNLGIEAVQLAVVAVVAPILFALAQTHAYTPVRIAGATVAGVAALAWAAERAFGWANPVAPWVERAADGVVWGLEGLALLALAATVWEHLQGRRSVTTSSAS